MPQPEICILITPPHASTPSSSLQTHSNSLIIRNKFYSFPSFLVTAARSTNFQIYRSVAAGILGTCLSLKKNASLIIKGPSRTGKNRCVFGSGLTLDTFGGFEPSGLPSQYPHDWGLFPRLCLQLLSASGGSINLTALQPYKGVLYDVFDPTLDSVTNFKAVNNPNELKVVSVDDPMQLVDISRRLQLARITVDVDHPEKHLEPIIVNIQVIGGGSVTISILGSMPTRERELGCGGLNNWMVNTYGSVVGRHALQKYTVFVSLLLCVAHQAGRDEEIHTTLEFGREIYPEKYLVADVEDLEAGKKELIEARLRVAKKDLESETDKNQTVLKQAVVRNLIERLAMLK
ncbi:hypothetical protein TrLO_g15631 [Triparma laevis f. longispina]|uniref:Uncharacterized protein n=1 Tax=Triparma laevis f. longispina TaxID=1714387 RepID=A0A9W7KZB6_9STRA|nr:hypothetical protein TrLO_g15631 [Triparma laevis f. longispina]